MQTFSTLSLPYLQQPIRTLASEAMQVQSHLGPEARQISHGATLVDRSHVQPAQLETTLSLPQLHALLALLVLLEQSRQKRQPSVLVSAVKASTVLLVPLELLRINAAGFKLFAHQEQVRPLRFQMASTRVR